MIQVVSFVCDDQHGEEKANEGLVVEGDYALVDKFHKDTDVAPKFDGDLCGDLENDDILQMQLQVSLIG